MKYYQLISIFSFSLVSYCVAEKTVVNKQKAFEELNEISTLWSDILTNPDIVVKLRNILYSYGSVKSNNTTLNVSHILQLNITDPILRLISSNCILDILYILGNSEKQWALQMLDAAGKIPSGIFRGNTMWTGNYKECMDVYAPSGSFENISVGNFHGQYCVASWEISTPSLVISPIHVKSGLCLPDTCDEILNEKDYGFLSSIPDLLPFVKEGNFVWNLQSLTCKPRSVTLDNIAISFLIVLSIFGIIILSGSLITIIEFYMLSIKNKRNVKHDFKETVVLEGTFKEPQITSYKEHVDAVRKTDDANDKKTSLSEDRECRTSFQKHPLFPSPNCCIGILCQLKRILQCFCVFTNGSKILNTKCSGEQLLCIHGIRFLSMTWVILLHTYVSVVTKIENIVDFVYDTDNLPFEVLNQATFSVDSFFLLSGFLVTYVFLKRACKLEGKINWFYFYIHRYWRLTPVYMILLGFKTAIFRYIGSGPLWDDGGKDAIVCRDTWWWNLLYINNFLNSEKICMGFSWYLANDMQFYVISPLFLYILWKRPKIGLTVISGLLVLSWIITGWISAEYKVMPFRLMSAIDIGKYTEYNERTSKLKKEIYCQPYCRIGPYLIGAILAFFVTKAGDKKNFLKMWQQVLGWCSAAFLSLSVTYGLYHAEVNRILIDFYNALSRSSFSLGLAWIIFACLTGHGGFINKLLSFKLWIPLSRLTYCAYLVHLLISTWFYNTSETPIHFTHANMVIYFLGILTWSYGFAFILSLAFELPMMNLEKLIVNHDS